jgi:hypothetical protein
MLVGSLGRGILWTWDSLIAPLYGLFVGCVLVHISSHVTRDTHAGLVARGWFDRLVFSMGFNLACSSTYYGSGGTGAGRMMGGGWLKLIDSKKMSFSFVNGKTHCALNHGTHQLCHYHRPGFKNQLMFQDVTG